MVAGRPANPLALAVLTLLWERPMHPYEMSTTLRERRKEDSIKLNYGSLYSVVESLRKRGLVEAQQTVRAGRRPERTVYAITEAGTTVMLDWLAELLSTPKKEYLQFEAALSVAAVLPPEEVATLLEQRLRTLRLHKNAADDMRERMAGFPELFVIESEFTYALLVAEIAYVEKLVERLRTGTLGGFAVWRRIHELRSAGIPPEEIEEKLGAEFADELRFLRDVGGDTGDDT